MVVNNAIENLLYLGFSEYEARAYLALLEANPITAYEIAKSAGLPTSKIYQVMARLAEKGFVLSVKEDSRNLYIPIQPEKIISNHRIKTEKTLTTLENELSQIKKHTEISYIWHIKQYQSLMQKAERMIIETESTLLISIWKQELNELLAVLKKAKKRGLSLATVHFGKPENPVGQTFQHPIEDTIYAEKGGRGFVLVADGREALMGTIYNNNQVEGAWSMNKGFVMLAEDYIKHDIYIMKIVKRFDQLLIKRFGRGYKKLRDIFCDEEEKNEDIH